MAAVQLAPIISARSNASRVLLPRKVTISLMVKAAHANSRAAVLVIMMMEMSLCLMGGASLLYIRSISAFPNHAQEHMVPKCHCYNTRLEIRTPQLHGLIG